MIMTRRTMLIGTVGSAAALTIRPAFAAVPPLKKKDTYKVGFAQTESNNPWRLAQTASMQDEAKKRGCQLVYTDAAELGRQAGRRRQQHDRPGRRLHLPRAARGEAADSGGHGAPRRRAFRFC